MLFSMKSLKKCNIPLLIVAVLAVALFIVGSFYDRQISETFWNKYQLNIPWFTIVITLLVPLITNAFGAFAGWSAFFVENNFKKKMSGFIKFLGIFGLAGVAFFAYISGCEFAEVIPQDNERVTAGLKFLVLTLVLATDVAMFFIVRKNYNKLDQHNLLWVALTMLAIIVFISCANEVVKYLASRPRPRIVFPGEEEYREWWQWKPLYGLKVSESKSFISGHASNGASTCVLFVLVMSLTKFSEKKHFEYLCFGIAGLYAFVVSLSRIFAIAHFMSDVSGGMLLSFVLSLVICRIMLLIQKKVEEYSSTSN